LGISSMKITRRVTELTKRLILENDQSKALYNVKYDISSNVRTYITYRNEKIQLSA